MSAFAAASPRHRLLTLQQQQQPQQRLSGAGG